MNEELDRRRVRRPLSMEEFARMLDAAEAGPELQHVSGPDRAVLYIVGAYTGYRRNEIGSVTRQSFDFDSVPPTLTVLAGHSKHRRTDILPLRKDFAERIRDWIAGKPDLSPDQPLFDIRDKRTAEMIRKDLNAARAKWIKDARCVEEREGREKSSFLAEEDEHGHVVDFHALRMTFITNLTRSGVSPKTAQTLARHSDINLTMGVYTKLAVVDQAAAVESLPPVPTTARSDDTERLLATGMDG
jgi:integrase